ncbi:hypothetical protein BZA05DRAFT_63749 [Tricharina praecox]|uniref:uncharacterized protein n=1 Tax=Tricharina praecox TaxID=43433 RepID=UPI00221F9999|nr:uncharacterized protein BZA05DRAFT_478040 [Tricharina praecox]XP_051338578.1 uncharacterized protein BZA05DRAFT_63749 [Tricharina praecox]KAI5840139.1 hypothetical protein BZA05DRAFT_478040 [Tricharina praecox]KAI5849934.1 hypothetical protein BZA05DRAFT_63749 [Tricharina praecox]
MTKENISILANPAIPHLLLPNVGEGARTKGKLVHGSARSGGALDDGSGLLADLDWSDLLHNGDRLNRGARADSLEVLIGADSLDGDGVGALVDSLALKVDELKVGWRASELGLVDGVCCGAAVSAAVSAAGVSVSALHVDVDVLVDGSSSALTLGVSDGVGDFAAVAAAAVAVVSAAAVVAAVVAAAAVVLPVTLVTVAAVVVVVDGAILEGLNGGSTRDSGGSGSGAGLSGVVVLDGLDHLGAVAVAR